ncbi:alpha-tocopherol transfer protein-like [Harpegnathos saltator]|nr:alpha-tocopherol transfer protein-like [Harpegnathos saltator]
MIGCLVDLDPSHFFFNELLNVGLMTHDEFVWTHGSTPGQIFVVDATGITIGHVGRLNIASIKKGLRYLQDAMPIRLKEVHVINTSPVVEIIYNMTKPFLDKELVKLIHFHASLESVSEHFPIEVLPNELGGKGGALQELMDAQFKRIENFREWFLEDEKNNRVNESLRIGKSKTSGDLFGVDGNFRKIEID